MIEFAPVQYGSQAAKRDGRHGVADFGPTSVLPVNLRSIGRPLQLQPALILGRLGAAGLTFGAQFFLGITHRSARSQLKAER
jgi:hypothetical protein